MVDELMSRKKHLSLGELFVLVLAAVIMTIVCTLFLTKIYVHAGQEGNATLAHRYEDTMNAVREAAVGDFLVSENDYPLLVKGRQGKEAIAVSSPATLGPVFYAVEKLCSTGTYRLVKYDANNPEWARLAHEFLLKY